MGISILGIAAIDFETLGSGKSKEQALNRLLNTGGIDSGKRMKNQGRARRTIAAVAGAMGTIALDMVLPGRLENNGIARARGRWAIHLERMHLIKLFAFASAPLRLGG